MYNRSNVGSVVPDLCNKYITSLFFKKIYITALIYKLHNFSFIFVINYKLRFSIKDNCMEMQAVYADILESSSFLNISIHKTVFRLQNLHILGFKYLCLFCLDKHTKWKRQIQFGNTNGL